MRSSFCMVPRDLKTPRPQKHNRIKMALFKASCFRHANFNRLLPRSICCSLFWALRVVPVHKTKSKTVSFTSPMLNDQLIQTYKSHLQLFFGFLLRILIRSYLLKKALNLEKKKERRKRRERQSFSRHNWHQLKGQSWLTQDKSQLINRN